MNWLRETGKVLFSSSAPIEIEHHNNENAQDEDEDLNHNTEKHQQVEDAMKIKQDSNAFEENSMNRGAVEEGGKNKKKPAEKKSKKAKKDRKVQKIPNINAATYADTNQDGHINALEDDDFFAQLEKARQKILDITQNGFPDISQPSQDNPTEDIAEEPPKKKPRKAKRKSQPVLEQDMDVKMDVDTTRIEDQVTYKAEQANIDDDEDVVANILNEAVVPKKSKKAKNKSILDRASSVDLDIAAIPVKLEKAKKTKSRKNLAVVPTQLQGYDDRVEAQSHQVLTPAPVLCPPVINPQQDQPISTPRLITDTQSEESNFEPEATPKPSKKALGKGKAAEPSPRAAKKKAKRRRKESGNRDIRQSFGSVLSDDARNSPVSDIVQEAFVNYLSQESQTSPLPSGPEFEVPESSPPFAVILPARKLMSNGENGVLKKKATVTPKASELSQVISNSSPKLFMTQNSQMTQDTRREELQDLEEEFQPHDSLHPSPEPEEIRSGMHRKRRLPVDIVETSPSTSIKKSAGRLQSTPNSNTPKSRTPNVKIPTSSAKTPRASTAPGRLSAAKTANITTAVDNYRHSQGMTQYKINDLIQKSVTEEGGKEMWQYIIAQVPEIPKQKLYNICRRTFHNYRARGVWTTEQDEDLRQCHKTFNGSWKKIGEALNRFPEDCRDRWRNYVICGNSRRKNLWGKDEEYQLKIAVKECIESMKALKMKDKDKQIGFADNERFIDWTTVSAKMNHTRTRLQCSMKWKSLKDREDSDLEDDRARLDKLGARWRVQEAAMENQKMTPADKLRFLYAIRDSQAGREGKIPWRRISKDDMQDSAKAMSWRLLYRRLRDKVPGNEDMKLQDIINVLIDAFEAAAPQEPSVFDELEAPFGDFLVKRPPKNKSYLSKETVDEADEDEEGDTLESSKPASRKRHKSLVFEENDGVGPSKQKKKKLRDRMNMIGKPQEIITDPDVDDMVEEIGESTFQDLRSGKDKSRKSKAQRGSLSKPKSSEEDVEVQEMSNGDGVTEEKEEEAPSVLYPVRHSSDEEQHQVSEPPILDEEDLDPASGTDISDDDLDEEADADIFDEEEDPGPYHDSESVDLDKPPSEETGNHSRLSPEFDDPPPHSLFPIAPEMNDHVHTNGYKHAYHRVYESSVSSDSDMEDIPAEVN
ncbi:hypothetical protein B7494_g4912 [Chlorociboria aeruginascens]|nr:hypothetical protein B7494_g4912 [Chlorociboria aeruginascens]